MYVKQRRREEEKAGGGVFLKMGESVRKRYIFFQNWRRFERYFLPKLQKI
jgi:hypothetical protein